MKKHFMTLAVILLGFLFLAVSVFLKDNGNILISWTGKVEQKCASLDKKCSGLVSILNELHNGGSGINRLALSKDKLPIVRIYMSDGAVQKVDDKRNSVLSMRRPIHLAEDKDWVKATIMVEYGQTKEKSKVLLRLKGDWGDHLEHPKKLSFRIKTRAGGYLFGMKALSIQHPKTRNYGNEPLLLDHMRSHDILVPRYSFVDVFVNDFPIGVMAIEEHFRKEMIEAQNRRDGPLLAINEDPLWEQWNINVNDENPVGEFAVNFSGPRDSMIKNFNKSKFDRGTIPTNNVIRGQALFRDFLDGEVSSRDAFDYEKLSKHWILVNIWGGCHSAIWHNRRFYFNPISGLLEPVGFDNIPDPKAFKVCFGFDVKAALQDPQFLTQVALSAEEIYEDLQSKEFEKKLADSQTLHREIFEYEGFEYRAVSASPEVLIQNLKVLLQDLSDNYGKYGDFKHAYVPPYPMLIGRKFLKIQSNINLHMSSFYYPYDKTGAFEFRNLTEEPIDITDVYILRKKRENTPLDIEAFQLPSALTSPGAVKVESVIPDEVLAKNSEFIVEYNYQGNKYTRPVYVQFKESPTGFTADPLAAIRQLGGKQSVHILKKEVVFAAGTHNFTQSIALPKGWRVIVKAGAELNFKNGALLKIQGPLNVKGTKTAPVLMNVESNTDFKSMGSWGGLVVSKSPKRSSVTHLTLTGNGLQNLNTRQGFYGMTGCFSFYESDVDISNSAFIDAQCEDALNIVKADFKLDNIVIKGARADAFDSDFSTGLIVDSSFIASGNDGIDVSGTQLSLNNITMTNIGDKAVSVGENSTLHADGINIKGAVLGLVSKDLSKARAKNVRFEDITGTALMTYIKKQEYGPSALECSSCTFIGKMTRIGAQEGTIIKLDGKMITRKTLSKKQMFEAGLIEQGT